MKASIASNPVRTRVKICGITCPEHAAVAAAAGTDAIGLVFYQPSPRAMDPEGARAVSRALPPFVARVALFLDPAPELVDGVLATVRPDVLQFHGNESPEFCRSFGLPYLKAVPMGEDTDTVAWAEAYADAAGLLLDGHPPGEAGGRGRRFDWSRAGRTHGPPMVAAGGLHADNVGEAVRNMRPYAVDVSSGVESAPGRKDPALIQAFIEAVHSADRG